MNILREDVADLYEKVGDALEELQDQFGEGGPRITHVIFNRKLVLSSGDTLDAIFCSGGVIKLTTTEELANHKGGE